MKSMICSLQWLACFGVSLHQLGAMIARLA